jgi:hypothetical protein
MQNYSFLFSLCSNDNFFFSESIRNPVQPLALPAQGRLVLGASRILEKKTQYIYTDATEVTNFDFANFKF